MARKVLRKGTQVLEKDKFSYRERKKFLGNPKYRSKVYSFYYSFEKFGGGHGRDMGYSEHVRIYNKLMTTPYARYNYNNSLNSYEKEKNFSWD